VRYRNPVHPGYFADPFVLHTAEGYVAYGTGSRRDGRYFEVLRSDDLVSWQSVGGALEPVAAELGGEYWAPEVAESGGRYHLYYSVGHDDRGHQLRVAVADGPFGPFFDVGANLTPDERFAIDPHPFRDDDGRWYLYFARDVLEGERVGTMLAVAPLTDMTALGPITPVLTPTADWQLYARGRRMYGQTYDWHTLEGPFVRRHAGRYYLLYSGGSWLETSYAVSWAVADSPLGPWQDPPAGRSQLLQTVPGHVLGPGHNSVTRTPRGHDVLAYHAWDPEKTARRLCIDPLVWTEDGPTCPGPTWTPTELPD